MTELEIGSINNGLLFKFTRYDNINYLESKIESLDNLAFFSIQGKFIKNNIYCYNITLYILFEIGYENDIVLEKDKVISELKRMNPDHLFGDLEIDQILYGKKVNLNQFLSSGSFLKINGPSYFYYYKKTNLNK